MKVKCIKGCKNRETGERLLRKDRDYEVAAVISSGFRPDKGKIESGYLLKEGKPIIWNFDRFKVIQV